MKQTFNIPDGCKIVSVEQIGNQLITSFEPDKYVPKKGDFVKAVDSCTAIFEVSGVSDGYLHLENVSITDGYINIVGDRFSITKKGKFQKLTPEEFKAEFEKLGYVYDFETHTAHKKRKRVDDGERYFFSDSSFEVDDHIEDFDEIDNRFYENGNYFATESECQKYCDYIKECSLKYFDNDTKTKIN